MELLPRPDEWPETRSGKVVTSLLFVVFLGLAGIPVGFGFVAAGIPGGLRYALVFSVLMFLTAAFGYFSQLRPRHRESDIAIVNRDGVAATVLRDRC
ncbi:hypothetical protein [Amycolatopsis albispora]|uniref:hypothetical protein n=1 Tax=Amycolatopsis albispora TaxID=1804986 RepID=UPI0013B39E72|nr:hypothetical protein [Amycolatopsis albispora]